MPIPFKISVTKQVIERCINCGVDKEDIGIVGNNCAIVVVLNGLFPAVFVSNEFIYPFGKDNEKAKIELPKIAKDFIKVFDSLSGMPRVRRRIPEFDFTIEIPDEIICMIDIKELLNGRTEKSSTVKQHFLFTC